MYSHLQLTGQLPDIADAHHYHKLLVAGNWAMIIGLAITVLSVLASYTFAHWFSMPVQIAAHMATLLFATLIKFGYIMRSLALHQFINAPKAEAGL